MVEELAKYSEAEFVVAFKESTVNEFCAMMEKDCGIQVTKAIRKEDTIKSAWAQIQALAAAPKFEDAPEPGTKEDVPPARPLPALGPSVEERDQMPPADPPAPSGGDFAPSEAGRVYLVRSRQPQGRWRVSHHFEHAFVEIPEGDFLPDEWELIKADAVLEVREK